MKFLKYCIVAFIALFSYNSYAQVAVIANKSVPVSSISAGQLTEIYLLHTKTWSNGKAVIPVTLKTDNETSKKFFGTVGKSSMEMKKFWMKAELTGEGQSPAGFGSDEEVLNKVASTPGAIGFVDADKVNDNVKVLMKIK
jgi:ABC-type phosphate transport system substrate-binding protein